MTAAVSFFAISSLSASLNMAKKTTPPEFTVICIDQLTREVRLDTELHNICKKKMSVYKNKAAFPTICVRKCFATIRWQFVVKQTC